MLFTEEELKYLSGELFSSGFQFKLRDNYLDGRINTLIKILKDKSVLHVGCCDHIPLIKEKINRNEWLQGVLDNNCKRVIGVDINQEAVDFVNSNSLAKENVYCADVTNSEFLERIPSVDFDYILLGEILEHVPNPVDFLSKLRIATRETNAKIIVTVPNAFSFLRKKKYNRGIEGINTDHKYWFTPFTAAKVFMMAGIKPLELLFANQSSAGGNGTNFISNIFFSIVRRLLKRPLKYKSFRGDQIIIVGE